MKPESEIAVRCLGAAPEPRWDRFVQACPDATFFHLSTWRGIIEDVFGHRTWYLFAERDAEIVAVLPLAEIRSLLFGRSLVSLPFCAYAGAVGDPDAVVLLEARAQEIARERRAAHLELRNYQTRHADWPRQDLYVTFRKQIAEDDDENMRAIPRKQRAMVRKAIKRGLRGEIDQHVDRFFALYSDNVRRHGTPCFPKRFFVELQRRFSDACEVLTVLDADGRPVSSVMSFYFRDDVLPYYAGDDVKARSLAANDFKYWDLMCRARDRGCKVFDFGRSKVGTGPWSFKRNWGFEPHPLSYEYCLLERDTVPQNNPLNPKYRLFIAMWRRLPLSVANAVGPAISRHLG